MAAGRASVLVVHAYAAAAALGIAAWGVWTWTATPARLPLLPLWVPLVLGVLSLLPLWFASRHDRPGWAASGAALGFATLALSDVRGSDPAGVALPAVLLVAQVAFSMDAVTLRRQLRTREGDALDPSRLRMARQYLWRAPALLALAGALSAVAVSLPGVLLRRSGGARWSQGLDGGAVWLSGLALIVVTLFVTLVVWVVRGIATGGEAAPAPPEPATDQVPELALPASSAPEVA